MAELDIDKIRNAALLGHSGSGKTTLVEAILFNCGAINRMGTINDGNTVTDFDQEEIERKLSIGSSVAYCNWSGYRINLIDTPGFINFMEEARGSLRVADGAVMFVSPIAGVKAETEKLWGYACEFELPRIVFINEMDKENTRFQLALDQIEKSFKTQPIPLNIPIGEGEGFVGVVDILNMKAYKHSKDNKYETIEIPSDISTMADDYRKALVEKVAEADDALLEKYLEGQELTNEELTKGIREGAITRKFIPVMFGSASKNIGVNFLIDAIINCLPSPKEKSAITPIVGKDVKTGQEITRQGQRNEPTAAFIFKTIADPYAGKLSLFRVYSGEIKPDTNVYNTTKDAKERIGQVFYMLGKKQEPASALGPGEIGVVAKLKETSTGDTLCGDNGQIVFPSVKFAEPIISYAIEPKSKGDEEKVSVGITRILEEDSLLKFHRDEETNEMILSGMGQVHIEVALHKLKRKFGVDVDMKTPKIPYRETIRKASKAQGKYKKQSGGKGQYGDCWIEIEPLERGGGFEFVDKIVGGSIPRQYIPAVEKGIFDKMKEGIIARFPLVDIRASLLDGSYHSVDSSEMAFKIAGSMALKKATLDANPVLLEPIMKVEVVAPDENLGAVIGDLNAKRGKVQGVDSQGANQKIAALVPMAEMLTYANQLQSITSGRGIYTMQFSHYEDVPAHISQKIIEERMKGQKEE
ncbi:translation elongation factor G [Candidatus Magnetoovum chiemensis]|nr:translation elongation factor G [Candidatus Magnetoovum chiemensis]